MELSQTGRDLKRGNYRHFKGDIVEVLDVALDSEDPAKEVVVYKHGENVWVRPLEMFLESVDRDGYSGPRFTYIET
ncbi:MAG: hypothetical protein JWO50_334 [Candidatus Kaiserbacteria bacterium]|nr:hypothetical protein [Candidatus Kaiserbacteria bacterium]